MIPADVANSLKQPLLGQQLATDAPTRPVLPTQQIADVLSDLVPGQRILAEIQSLLPNGSYRAVVAQRDITLALPFSAKPGDTLELEVAESDGKLTLAFPSPCRKTLTTCDLHPEPRAAENARSVHLRQAVQPRIRRFAFRQDV